MVDKQQDGARDAIGTTALDSTLSAHTILRRLRAGDIPSASKALDLHTATVLDELRPLIEPTDIEWIFSLASTADDERAALYLSLLAPHATRPEVQEALRRAWETGSVYLKTTLLWRLIDDPRLPIEWHKKLFKFVLREWAAFQKHSLSFFDGRDETVVTKSLDRYFNPGTPESKKWAYLCSIANVERYPFAVQEIVELGLTNDNEFVREVAATLLDRRQLRSERT
jgi:hypothetical protein